jgi:hypothetical protein
MYVVLHDWEFVITSECTAFNEKIQNFPLTCPNFIEWEVLIAKKNEYLVRDVYRDQFKEVRSLTDVCRLHNIMKWIKVICIVHVCHRHRGIRRWYFWLRSLGR